MYSPNHLSHRNVVCFSCKGNESTSYLKSGNFHKLINSELTLSTDPAIKLFGKSYSTNSFNLWTNMHQLFKKIKMNFFIVKSLALNNTESFQKQSDIDCESLRTDISNIFSIFLSSLQKISSPRYCTSMMLSDENSHLKNSIAQLMQEIKHLLLWVGRITSVPGISNIRDFNSDTSKSSTNYYHYFHLCLDIWHYCVAMLYMLDHIMPVSFDEMFCDFIDQSSPFLQLASLVVYELSFLAITHYNNIHMYSKSPFVCPCFSEFWVLLINLIDNAKSQNDTTSFYNIYLSNLQIISKSVSSKSEVKDVSIDTFSVIDTSLHIANSNEVFLWLTSHIAPLYKYNTLGYFCEYQKAKSGYVVAKYLVHNLLSNEVEAGEKNLRTSLSYCIQLVKLWEPSGDILLPLTDFYIKKIDGTFSVQGMDFSYLFKDSVSWFTYIKTLSNSVSLGKESSFDHFLCILSAQLKADVDHSLWRSLKGRIYSKFIPKRVKELSEVGLQNSFSLFHVIVMADQSEIINKMCEFASIIETVANPRKQMISWKALFVLIYICQEKKCSTEKITMLISKFFNSVCSDYAKIGKDSMHRSNLMNLLSIYIDNMGELFKRSDCLNLSEYQLISPGFADLLNTCGATEGNYILNGIYSVLQKVQTMTDSSQMDYVTNETEYIKILQVIFDNIYPFIEKIAVADTAPLIVASIAGILTKLTYDFSSLINCIPHGFHKIFMHFACNEAVSPCITCPYLTFILYFTTLMEDMKLQLKDLDSLIFQSWLKCILYTHTKNESLQELNKKVILGLFSDIFPDVKRLDFGMTDHASLSVAFFALVGNDFSKSDLPQKIKMANRLQLYFKKYVLLAENKIKKHKDKSALTHVYKLTSNLVKHCSLVLHYRVSSDHILLQILDQTVYPQLIIPRDKALQSLVAFSIKEYLPNFMRGLFKLEYRKDKSIEREIRDMFIYYIGMFPETSNPLTKLVVDTVTKKPDGLTLDAYSFILEVLKSSLLSSNVENPKSIFEFYQEVFRLVPPACKKEITNTLLICAMEIYMKQNDSVTEFLKVLIKKILIYFRDKMQVSHTKIILAPVIQWFIQEKLQWAVVRGFSLLDLFVECLPHVISDLVPFLTKSVETLEKNRGLGEDMLLRNGLKNVVVKLQRKLTEV